MNAVRVVAELGAVYDPALPESVASFDALLDSDADAVVIATPSALHAEQAEAALRRGKAVFCQKPLGRNAEETRRVIEAARAADRLLGVDLSYRYTGAMINVRNVVQSGELGDVFAVDLVFHNAYGPDKPWFYDPQLSGGGCVIDLGIHLVDMALWTLGFPPIGDVRARLFHHRGGAVEDYATAQFDHINLACSWNLHAGRDCEIKAAFYGTRGGAAFRNIGGSFYDFVAERYDRTSTRLLAEPPDEWGGRAIVAWAKALAASAAFDPEVSHVLDVSYVLDRIYEAGR
jgi:predicted dehydrogenase